VVLLTAQGLPWGEERWWSATFVRIAAPVITAPAMVILYLRDTLTVESAFAIFIGTSLISNAPLVYMMFRTGRWRYRARIVREGLRFGSRAWLGNLFNSTYARLDQVLMAGLVVPRELGLYAVAVSVAGVPGSFTGAIATAINPRVAQGRRELVRQSCRVGFFLTLCGTIAMAIIVPFFLPLLFGDGFEESVVLTWILLVGATAYSVFGTLLSAISAAGHPGIAARAQLLILVPTIAALVLLLPSTGAVGAAVITSTSNALLCGVLLIEAPRLMGGRIRDYVVIRPRDLHAIRQAVKARKARS
jgi:O-antigen/teichoic acid export membrane protein